MTDPDAPASTLGDPSMRAAILSVLASGLCFAVVGAAAFGVRAGLGVAIGGVAAAVNLAVFARVGQAFVDRRGSTAPWGIIAVFKMVFLFGGVSLILKSGVVPWLSFAAGYAALPFGITFASLFGPKPPESDAPPRADMLQARPSADRKPSAEGDKSGAAPNSPPSGPPGPRQSRKGDR